MNFKLYQINPNYINANKYIFMPFNMIQQVNVSLYDKVWESEEDNLNLEYLFCKYNDDNRPNGKVCRSISTSDIVIIKKDEKEECYYCDMIGWEQLSINPFDN